MRAARDPGQEMDTIVPHESLGADCCGCIVAVSNGHEADLVCNECKALIRTVPASEVDQILAQLAASDEICSAKCPSCGVQNLFPGFSAMHAFTCRECGEGVAIERAAH
jgi:peptide subunit release factor 1 (eRF1)